MHIPLGVEKLGCIHQRVRGEIKLRELVPHLLLKITKALVLDMGSPTWGNKELFVLPSLHPTGG